MMALHLPGLRRFNAPAERPGPAWRIVGSAILMLLLSGAALADDLRIELQAGAGDGKDLVIQLETFKGTSTISVQAPASAADAAAAIKQGFDNQNLGGDSGAGKVSVTTETVTKKVNGVDVQFVVIVISPSTINFNGGFIKTNPFPGGGTSAISESTGDSRFRIESGDNDPGGVSDWNLLLLGQDQSVLGEANLSGIASSIAAGDLLALLFADLQPDVPGLSLVGNELVFGAPDNLDNAYFLYSLSGASSLTPIAVNHVVPIPGTWPLLGLGLLALGVVGSRRRS